MLIFIESRCKDPQGSQYLSMTVVIRYILRGVTVCAQRHESKTL